MEGRAMVSYLTGSMNTLLDKLTKLENRPKIIQELQEDLVTLKEGFFDKLAGRGEMDGQVKEWTKLVRELFFDIEDWIDQKPETNTGESERKEKIEEFKILIQEARDLCTRYELLKKAPICGADVAGVAPSEVAFDYRLLLGEKTCLVGLDRPKKQLKKRLTDEQKKLKVVSIVGTGGLGKTTLAKEVHGELLKEFQCGAFVHVGRNPSIRTILINILHQIMSPSEREGVFEFTAHEREGVFKFRREPGVIRWKEFDENQVIALLWKLLGTKRYFIVLDGIWSIRAWRVISCALPDNNLGSRILTTTRIKGVAESCSPRYTDVVHQMEALGKEVSKNLYVEQAKRPVDDDILKMCCGMPLAIIVAAGLLPRKSEEPAEPKILGKSVLSSLDQYSTSEGMTKILHMSYADLSLPVQSCFLYLGIFPEYYTIKKDRLIRLWGAEGFIPRRDEESLWETGENYFNELVSRRLLQPVFDYADGQAVGCTVDAVILDFIRSLSREDNFAIMAAELSSGPFPCDTIRRFSFDCDSNKEEAYTSASSRVDLTRVRSLTVFGDVRRINYHSAFKLIRILDLEDTKNGQQLLNLKGTLSLFLLRYLGLAGTSVTNKDVHGIVRFQHLQTLDLRRTEVRELPQHFDGLSKLVSVLGDGLCFYSRGEFDVPSYQHMQHMEELSTIDVTKRSSRDSVAKLLVSSQGLRMLGVSAYGSGNCTQLQYVMSFLDELRKYNLESLVIHGDLDTLDEWAPWPKLRRFQLTKPLPRVPHRWASLGNLTLTHLDIKIGQIEAVDIVALGKLHTLMVLKLFSLGYDENGCIVSTVGFQSLEVAWFMCPNDGMGLQFARGAMPKLRRLRLDFNAGKTKKKYANRFDFGIQFPSSLAQVHVTINCKGSTLTDVDDAVFAIRDQISRHPRKPNPSLVLVKHDESSMKNEFPSKGQGSNTIELPKEEEASASSS